MADDPAAAPIAAPEPVQPPAAGVPTLWLKAAEARRQGISWDDINAATEQRRQEMLKAGVSAPDIDAAMRMDGQGNVVKGALSPADMGWTYQAEAATGSQQASDVARNFAAPYVNQWQQVQKDFAESLPTPGQVPPGFGSWDAAKDTWNRFMATGRAAADVAGLAGMVLTGPLSGLLNAGIIEPGAWAASKIPGVQQPGETAANATQRAREAIEDALFALGAKGGVGAGRPPGGPGAFSWWHSGSRVPPVEEFVDGANVVHGMAPDAAGKPSEPSHEDMTITMKNMGQHWAMTGEEPAMQTARSQADANFRLRLMAPDRPAPNASVTHVGPDEHYVINLPAPEVDPASPTGSAMPKGPFVSEKGAEPAPTGEVTAPQVEEVARREQLAQTTMRQHVEDINQRFGGGINFSAMDPNSIIPLEEPKQSTGSLIPFSPRELMEAEILPSSGFTMEGPEPAPIRMGYEPPDSDAGKILGPGFEMYSPRDLVRLNVMSEAEAKEATPQQIAAARITAARATLRRAARGRKGRGKFYSQGYYKGNIPVSLDGREWSIGDSSIPSGGKGPPAPPDFIPPNLGHIPLPEGGPKPRLIEGPEGTEPQIANPGEILRSKIGAGEKMPLGQRVSGWLNRFYYNIINDEHPFNRLAEATQSQRPVEDMANIKFLRKLAQKGHVTFQQMVLQGMQNRDGDITGPSLVDVLKPIKDQDKFEEYAVARRAIELSEAGKTQPFDVKAAQRMIELHRDEYEGHFQRLVDWQNGTLHFAHEHGLMSADALQQTITGNKARVPFYHWYDEFEGSKFQTQTAKPTKQFFGSERPIRPIIHSIVQDAMRRVIASRENLANLMSFEAAEPFDLATSRNAGKADIDPAAWYDLNIDPDQHGWEDTEVANASAMENFSKFAAQKGLRPDETPVFRDGRMLFVKWADPLMLRASRHMDRPTLGMWTAITKPFTKMERALITRNPKFALRNFIGDMQWQAVFQPGMRNTLGEALSGFYHSLTGSDMFKEWSQTPAAESLFDSFSTDRAMAQLWQGVKEDPAFGMRALHAITTPARAMFNLMRMVTTAQRLGRYAAERNAGQSKLYSTVSSMNAVFHDPAFGGAQSKALNQQAAFLLASFNALDQTMRGQFGFGANSLGQKSNPAWFSAKATMVYAVPALVTYAMFHDDKRWQAAPTWQKMSGLVIPVGGDPKDPNSGHTIYIPWLSRPAMLYAGLPVAILDHFVNNHPFAKADIIKGILSSFSPGANLAIGDFGLPFAEWIAGRHFFSGTPMVGNDKALPAEQGTANSSPTAVAVARAFSDVPLLQGLNMPPQVVQNFIQDWGGGDALAILDRVLRSTGATPPRMPGVPLDDMPLMHSFLSRHPGVYTQPYDDFQAAMQHADQVHGSLRKLWEAGDLERFKSVLSENPTEAGMHALKFRQDAAILAAPKARQFIDALQAATTPQARQAAAELDMVQKAMTHLKQGAANAYALGQTGKLSPEQTQRALDSAYMQIMAAAQRGNALLNGAP